MNIQMKIFSIFFGLLCITEFIGFLGGRLWCLFGAILTGVLSVALWQIAKHEDTEKGLGHLKNPEF